jgi:hypothetical protein
VASWISLVWPLGAYRSRYVTSTKNSI